MIDRFKALGISNQDIADRLGVTPSAVSMKVNGHRPWMRDEIDAVLGLAREKDPAVTYELLFGEQPPEAEPVEAVS